MTVAPVHIRDAVLAYLSQSAAPAFLFWTAPRASANVSVVESCDVLYTLALTGTMDRIAPEAPARFASLLRRYRLAGGLTPNNNPPLSVHATAYALGALQLLAASGRTLDNALLADSNWKIDELIDSTLLPRWPRRYSHHSWRVSHWIGGAPSILRSLRMLRPDLAQARGLPAVRDVLMRADTLISDKTGMLHPYRSPVLQSLFRLVYRLRHDPALADIGGVVHLHWINYAEDRLPYRASAALHARVWQALQRRPFMEDAPYCLDFDVVQIARTSVPDDARAVDRLRARIGQYQDDLRQFYSNRLGGDYELHKLPGGLATLHECALALGSSRVWGLGVEPVDIIKRASWL